MQQTSLLRRTVEVEKLSCCMQRRVWRRAKSIGLSGGVKDRGSRRGGLDEIAAFRLWQYCSTEKAENAVSVQYQCSSRAVLTVGDSYAKAARYRAAIDRI